MRNWCSAWISDLDEDQTHAWWPLPDGSMKGRGSIGFAYVLPIDTTKEMPRSNPVVLPFQISRSHNRSFSTFVLSP